MITARPSTQRCAPILLPMPRAGVRLRPLFLAMLFALVAMPLAFSRVHAVETWCADDPVVEVGGKLVDIQVQVPVDYVATMRSTTLTVIIPSNVTGRVVVDDVSAFPMTTTISATGAPWDGTGDLPIVIDVYVDASVTFPVRVVATQEPTATNPTNIAQTESTSNVLIRLPMGLKP